MPINTNILKIFYSISSFVFCCFPLPSQPSGLPERSRGSSHATPPDQRPPPHRTPAGVPGISGAPACSRLCAPEPNQRPGTNTNRSVPFHPGSAPFQLSAIEISAFALLPPRPSSVRSAILVELRTPINIFKLRQERHPTPNAQKLNRSKRRQRRNAEKGDGRTGNFNHGWHVNGSVPRFIVLAPEKGRP